MNNKKLIAMGVVILLVVIGGIYFKKPEEKVEIIKQGVVGGYLSYPSEGIPEGVGVCAQRIDNPELLNCVKQIKDKKYKTGVGFEMNLDPGNYYVYAFNKEIKAYYDEFVLCGLKATCKSHTKIPVVVTAGSVQDNILPHDWYDETPKETLVPTAKTVVSATTAPTSAPTATAPTAAPTSVAPTIKVIKPLITITIPKITIKVPTVTPTPIKIVIPTLSIPKWW